MGIFSGIETVQAEGYRRSFAELKPGHCWVRIDNVFVGETRDETTFFQADLTVVKSLTDQPDAHRVGDEIAFRFSRGGAMMDQFLPKVRGFVEKTLQVEDVSEEDMDQLVQCPEMVQWRTIEIKSRVHTSKSGKVSNVYAITRYVPKDEVEAELGAELVEKFYPENVLGSLED